MKIVKLVPTLDRVLVKPVELGEQKKGNILIPDLGEEKAKVGKVVAVGPGRMSEFGKDMNVCVKEGDIVVVSKIGAQKVEVQDEVYWLVQDKEIIGIATVEE